MHRQVKTKNEIVTLVIRAGKTAGVMVTVPMKTEKQNMAIAIESTCPSERMVAFIPDAMPRYRGSTELMIAFVLGDEKSAYPKPSTIKAITIAYNGVAVVKKMKNASPNVVIAIPTVATIRGSMRSDIFPATGEKRVWTTGWATSMNPAVSAENPWIYWRYKERRTATAKVAP